MFKVKNLKTAWIEAETIKEHKFIGLFLQVHTWSHSFCLQSSDICPGISLPTMAWGLLHQLPIKQKPLCTCSQDMAETFSEMGLSPFRYVQVCVQMTMEVTEFTLKCVYPGGKRQRKCGPQLNIHYCVQASELPFWRF